MAKRRTAREQVLTLLTERTQKQVAKMLGVSERTIRRWKNEGMEPRKTNAATLARVAKDERREIQRKQRVFRIIHEKTGKKLHRAIPFVPMPIQIMGTRRVYADQFTGAPYLSDNVFYDVSRLDDSEIIRLLERLRDSRKYGAYSLIGHVPIGGTSPGGHDFVAGGRFGSEPQAFENSRGLISTQSIYDVIDYNMRHNAHGYIRRLHFVIAYPNRRTVKERKKIIAKRHERHEKQQEKKRQERKKKRLAGKS